MKRRLVLVLIVLMLAAYVHFQSGREQPGSTIPAQEASIQRKAAKEVSGPERIESRVEVKPDTATTEARRECWPWLEDGFGSQPRATLTGTVLTRDGLAAVGAEVAIYVNLDSDPPDMNARTQGQTDEDGRFSIAHAPAVRMLDIVVRHREGRAFRRMGMLRVATSHDIGEIELEPVGELRGVVTDSNGTPVPGVPFRCARLSRQAYELFTSTDSTGEYSFELMAGIYEIDDETYLVRANEVTERNVILDVELCGQLVYDDGSVVRDGIVDVYYGEDKHYETIRCDSDGRFAYPTLFPYPVTLVPGSGQMVGDERALAGSPGSMEFVIPRGADVIARVSIPRGDRSVSFMDCWLEVDGEKLSGDFQLERGGEVRFSNVVPGAGARFFCQAWKHDEISHEFRTPDSGSVVLEFDLTPTPRKADEVQVRVSDTLGNGVAGARVMVDFANEPAISDESGIATLTVERDGDSEPPTEIDVLVTARGFVPRDRRLDLSSGDVPIVVLEPEVSVTVEIMGADGAVVEPDLVWVTYGKDLNYDPIIDCPSHYYEGYDWRTTELEQIGSADGVSWARGAGAVELHGLPPGTHALFVDLQDGTRLKREIAVLQGRPTRKKILLPPPFTVEFTLEGAASPCEFLDVLITREDSKAETVRLEPRFASDGRLSVELMFPGEYSILVEDPLTSSQTGLTERFEPGGAQHELSF